jgi:pimeloyl-ACP methyl ester carboxylesterase
LNLFGPPPEYRRKPTVILINGLAEQPESWFCNRPFWEKWFDLKVPELLVYDGPVLAKRIEEGQPVSVPFFVDQLELFLDNFVQTPPYHIVASSLGGQIAVEYAVRHPERVGRMALLCPSGFGGEEKLPVADGARGNNFEVLVGSVFHEKKLIDPGMVRLFESQFVSRQFRKGLLRTVRGTSKHSVREKLPLVTMPVLLVCGKEDQVVDPRQAAEAVKELPNYRTLMLEKCGHAPQIEMARRVNRVVRDFLLEPMPKEKMPVPVGASAQAANDAANSCP